MDNSDMKQIQWFPGHMAKTRRLIAANLKLVDAVVEIVDARTPLSSRNPEMDSMTRNKPRLIILNKCDLADEKATQKWIGYFRSKGSEALAVDCTLVHDGHLTPSVEAEGYFDSIVEARSLFA